MIARIGLVLRRDKKNTQGTIAIFVSIRTIIPGCNLSKLPMISSAK